ncbi:insulinase family protein [Halovulum dunhuangense]|uniref:Insulinase family protein n=1 Tax=Halovulum dunhuangense TaxID=1505036 RepID=A0A849L0E6_9RHOB|nr:pitrilysin family protein [Halovulum dunhuangense]NNU79731.1 insulinase family protein [Halovulum dunhuangense]
MTVRTHRLPNGLRIVTETMPGLQSAAIGIWVNAGCRHETEAENGIAHFLEHMAFKGTARRSALQIAEAIEDVGGYINAYTSRETTAYYARVLGADVPLALDVISDIVLNPAFDQKEIETERGVILQEIGQALDTPDDIIFDWLQEVSFPGQSMGRPILGPPELVSRFTREDLTRFVANHYGPGQLILAAAGQVDHDAIVAQAEQIFGDIPARPGQVVELARYSGGERRKVKKLEQAHFALSLESPSYRADEIYSAQLHAAILGGGMSSRLFQEAREKRGLCYTIFAQTAAYADSGALMIYAGTAGSSIRDLSHVVTDELKRLPDSLTDAELERARAQMKAGLLMGLEGPSGRCERLARMLAIWDRVPDVSEAVERIDAVTRDDVASFGARLCETAAPALALYGPVSRAPDHESIRARLAA